MQPENNVVLTPEEAQNSRPRLPNFLGWKFTITSLVALSLVGVSLPYFFPSSAARLRASQELQLKAVCSQIAKSSVVLVEQGVIWDSADIQEKAAQLRKQQAEEKKSEEETRLASYRKQLSGQTCLPPETAPQQNENSPS